MSKVSIDRELLERLVAGWTQSTDVFGPMQELRRFLGELPPAQDEREAFETDWPAISEHSCGEGWKGLARIAYETAWQRARPAQAEQAEQAELAAKLYPLLGDWKAKSRGEIDAKNAAVVMLMDVLSGQGGAE